MNERAHNVIPIEVAQGHGRRGGHLRIRSGKVGNLTARRRRREAAGVLERVSAEERTRGKLRDLAIREAKGLMGDLDTFVKPLGVPGSFLRLTKLLSEQIVVIHEKEAPDAPKGSEATGLFVIEGGEICMMEKRFLLPEVIADWRSERIDTTLPCFHRAEGDELMGLCQDLYN